MALIKKMQPLTHISGSVNKTGITFRTWKGRQILETPPIPSYTRTDPQDQQRTAFYQAVQNWLQLSEQEKQQYNQQAEKYGWTGMNLYISQQLTGPPGLIYKINIENIGSALSDYQILLQITNDQTFFQDLENDPNHIEFYDSDRFTPLNFWIQEFDTTNHNAKIWIQVPSIPANSTKSIYLKPNLDRTESLSNAETTFDFYDNFLGTSLDDTKWIEYGAHCTYSVSDSILQINGCSDWEVIGCRQQFTPGHAFHFYAKLVEKDIVSISITDKSATGRVQGSGMDAAEFTYISSEISGGKAYKTRRENNITVHQRTSDLSTYTHLTIAWLPDIVKFYESLVLKDTISTNVPEDSCGFEFAAFNSGSTIWVDWVFVTKYTDPEPTISYQRIT